MSLSLRRARPDEAATLAALWRATFSQSYEGVHAPENITAYCDVNMRLEHADAVLRDGKHVCVFGCRDNVPTGYCVVEDAPCPIAVRGPSAELRQIYLLPSEFGSGLAQLLFDDAVNTVRGLGGAYMWLAVADWNRRAKAFYRKHKFRAVGVGPTFMVGTEPVTSKIMVKRLA